MASLENNTSSRTETLPTLLTSARAILTHTQQKLTQIYSRKGKQVITKHQYTLQPKLPPTKKRKKNQDTLSQHDDEDESSTSEEDLFTLKDNVSTKNVDDVIASWRYGGEALTKEKIAIDEFIDTSLEGYEDVVRLHDKYDKLLGSYGELLMDKAESRMAVNILLSNLKKLEEAIVEIHVQTHDVPDEVKLDEDVSSLMRILSDNLKSLKSKVPGLHVLLPGKVSEEGKKDSNDDSNDNNNNDDNIDVDVNVNVILSDNDNDTTNDDDDDDEETDVEEDEDVVADQKRAAGNVESAPAVESDQLDGVQEIELNDSLIKFNNPKQLKCRHTLEGHDNIINAIITFERDGKYYLASASKDRTIKLWDLSNNTVISSFTGHTKQVLSLAYFVKDGVPMLASGSLDKTIKLWDLTKNTNIQTFKAHHCGIRALETYEKDGKVFLVSGSYGTIKVWDLENFEFIAKLTGENRYINGLCAFYHDDKPYLAGGSEDGNIKLYCLCNFTLITTIKNDYEPLESLAIVEHNGKKMLISGDCNNHMKLWSMESFELLQSFRAKSSAALGVMQCHDKPLLITAATDDLFGVRNIGDAKVIGTVSVGSTSLIGSFMKDGQACLATAGSDNESTIQLWME